MYIYIYIHLFNDLFILLCLGSRAGITVIFETITKTIFLTLCMFYFRIFIFDASGDPPSDPPAKRPPSDPAGEDPPGKDPPGDPPSPVPS